MSAQPTAVLSEADYLERERASITKHEYYAGAIFALTGASEKIDLPDAAPQLPRDMPPE